MAEVANFSIEITRGVVNLHIPSRQLDAFKKYETRLREMIMAVDAIELHTLHTEQHVNKYCRVIREFNSKFTPKKLHVSYHIKMND